jgi:hypothetical protein
METAKQQLIYQRSKSFLSCMKKFLFLSLSFLLFIPLSKSQNNSSDDFYKTNTIQEIKITLKQDNWRSLLDSLRKNGDNYLVGTAVINGKSYNNVGVKYRGSRSFKVGAKRNPLHIKLNFIDKDQTHQGHKSIKLSNALRDPSMIREVLGFEIARKYMPAPRANYAQIYINDDYYGLLVNVEDIDKPFLEKNFGSSDGTLLKCSPDLKAFTPDGCQKNVFAALVYEEDVACYLNNYELKSESGWDDLIALTKTLAQNPDQVHNLLNVDRTLWMLAFNNALVNLSSYSGRYSQNYFLYKDAKGRFNPIIWDLNLAFGSFKSAFAGSDLRLKQLQELDPLMHIDNKYKPLISQLLKNPENKKVYLAHLRTILYDNFVNKDYEKRAEELQTMISIPFINDDNQKYTYDELKKSMKSTIGTRSRIPGIKELMGKRSKILKKKSELRVVPPSISEVQVLKRAQYASNALDQFTIQAKVDKLPNKVKLLYRYSKDQDFMEVAMLDNGKDKDQEMGDDIYTATVSRGPSDQIEYYIVAENKAAINFEPANYMYNVYEATIEELN